MPFTVQPSGYIGGQLLAQGLSQFGQGIGNAIQQYTQLSNQTAQSDALMQYLSQQQGPDGKPIIDQQAYQRYLGHSATQRAYVAGGMQAGMQLANAMQRQAWENRLTASRAAYFGERGSFQPGITTVTGPDGQQVPVLRTSPGRSQVLPGTTAPQPGPPPAPGLIWNGKGWIQQRAGQASPADQMKQAQLGAIDAEIQQHQTAIAQGDTTYHNPNAWFDFSKPRSDRVWELQRAKAALTGGGAGAPVPGAPQAAPAPAGVTGGPGDPNATGINDQQIYQQGGQPLPPQAQGGDGGGGGQTAGPPPGTQRVINGQQAVWDGQGWKAVGG